MATTKAPAGPPALPRQLTMDERDRLTVTGVNEIVHFDGAAVVMRQDRDLLVVRGEELTLRQLEPVAGKVEVRGRLSGLSYEQAPGRGGFLRRLLG